MQFPSVCPEIPVSDLSTALAYYRDKLSFKVDRANGKLPAPRARPADRLPYSKLY